ncbi:MAG: hypothetical protein AB1726_03310 [Planctomycetota bacterium]
MLAEFEAWVARKEKEWAPYERLLRELAAMGTPEAIGSILDLMRRDDVDFWSKAEIFAEVLMPLEDPRIGPAAAAMIDHLASSGEDGDPLMEPYFRLVAVKFGAEGAEVIVSALEQEDDAFWGEAMSQVRLLRDFPHLLPRILAAARKNPEECRDVLVGLASWEEPGALQAVRGIMLDSGEDERLRESAAQGIGEFSSAEDVVRLAGAYWQASSTADKSTVFAMLRGAVWNRSVDAESLRTASSDIVRSALQEDDPSVWRMAVWLVRDAAALQTDATVSWLEALQNRLEDRHQRQEIQGVLTHIRKSR